MGDPHVLCGAAQRAAVNSRAPLGNYALFDRGLGGWITAAEVQLTVEDTEPCQQPQRTINAPEMQARRGTEAGKEGD
jgi:hypothetical protein